MGGMGLHYCMQSNSLYIHKKACVGSSNNINLKVQRQNPCKRGKSSKFPYLHLSKMRAAFLMLVANINAWIICAWQLQAHRRIVSNFIPTMRTDRCATWIAEKLSKRPPKSLPIDTVGILDSTFSLEEVVDNQRFKSIIKFSEDGSIVFVQTDDENIKKVSGIWLQTGRKAIQMIVERTFYGRKFEYKMTSHYVGDLHVEKNSLTAIGGKLHVSVGNTVSNN